MNDQQSNDVTVRDQIVTVWNGEINLRVLKAGSGPAVVYFHPAGGLYWDPFLDRLAESYTVYAPELPGTTPGDPYAIYKIDSYAELLLIFEEVINGLDVEQPVAIGQSMGGMIALDLAANYRGLFSRVIALAPTGLWRDDAPVGIADLYATPPEQVPAFLFDDPGIEAAQNMFSMPEDPEEIPMRVAQNVWALGCAGKFLWPIPDHGLGRRLFRIDAPTLILWGREDRVVPSVYAEDFAEGIPDCEVRTLDNCGHILQLEKLDEAAAEVSRFLS